MAQHQVPPIEIPPRRISFSSESSDTSDEEVTLLSSFQIETDTHVSDMLEMDSLQSLNESVRDDETAEWEFVNFYIRDEMVFRLRVLHANEPICFELEITENYPRHVARRAFDELVRLARDCPNMDCRVIERIRGIPENW